MNRILDLIERAIFTQRVIALALLGVCCYLWVAIGDVPESLKACFLIVLGFFFSNELSQTLIKFLIDELRRR